MERNVQKLATEPEVEWADEASLDLLYRRYAPWLGAMLRKRFGASLEAEADDLVQETYARLTPIEAAGIRQPQALLMRVASNLARDVLRRRAVRSRFAAEAEAGPQPQAAFPDPLDELLFREAILSIPEPYRDVFILSRFDGLTYEEIATRCGLSIKSVEWRLSKALAHCTKRPKD